MEWKQTAWPISGAKSWGFGAMIMKTLAWHALDLGGSVHLLY